MSSWFWYYPEELLDELLGELLDELLDELPDELVDVGLVDGVISTIVGYGSLLYVRAVDSAFDRVVPFDPGIEYCFGDADDCDNGLLLFFLVEIEFECGRRLPAR